MTNGNGSYPRLPRFSIDALGIDTSYYQAGNPERAPVVLLHGMSTSGDSFRELMHELSEDYFLIAPDLPGFGYSEQTAPYLMPHLVEWLAAFLDALELRSTYIAGHSFGGVVASSFALAYPEDVRAQVLLAPALLVPQDFPEWMIGLSRFELSKSLMGLGISASRLMLQRQLRLPFYDPDRMDDSLWERREEDYARSRASAEAMRAVALNNVLTHLPQLRQPHCLIWGANDNVVDPAGVQVLSELLPHAETHLLPDCGHAPQIERVEQTAHIMRRFLPGAM